MFKDNPAVDNSPVPKINMSFLPRGKPTTNLRYLRKKALNEEKDQDLIC